MAKPIVYTWQDAGAPVCQANMTSFIALIKACLVTGYGAKSGAGWTIPFEDANSFVLKQGGTNPKKHCMKMFDYLRQSNRCNVVYTVAEDYTDLITPINIWHWRNGIVRSNPLELFPTGYTSSTNHEIPWKIIATNRSVYFFFGYNTTISTGTPDMLSDASGESHMLVNESFFGDYKPYADWNDYNVCYVNGFLNRWQAHSGFLDFLNNTTQPRSRLISPTNLRDTVINPTQLHINIISRANVAVWNLGNNRNPTSDTSFHGQISNTGNEPLFLDVVRLANTGSMVGEMPGQLYAVNGMYFSKENPTVNNLQMKAAAGVDGENLHIISGWTGQLFIHDGDWGVE